MDGEGQREGAGAGWRRGGEAGGWGGSVIVSTKSFRNGRKRKEGLFFSVESGRRKARVDGPRGRPYVDLGEGGIG